jgi:hypothetical protein
VLAFVLTPLVVATIILVSVLPDDGQEIAVALSGQEIALALASVVWVLLVSALKLPEDAEDDYAALKRRIRAHRTLTASIVTGVAVLVYLSFETVLGPHVPGGSWAGLAVQISLPLWLFAVLLYQARRFMPHARRFPGGARGAREPRNLVTGTRVFAGGGVYPRAKIAARTAGTHCSATDAAAPQGRQLPAQCAETAQPMLTNEARSLRRTHSPLSPSDLTRITRPQAPASLTGAAVFSSTRPRKRFVGSHSPCRPARRHRSLGPSRCQASLRRTRPKASECALCGGEKEAGRDWGLSSSLTRSTGLPRPLTRTAGRSRLRRSSPATGGAMRAMCAVTSESFIQEALATTIERWRHRCVR